MARRQPTNDIEQVNKKRKKRSSIALVFCFVVVLFCLWFACRRYLHKNQFMEMFAFSSFTGAQTADALPFSIVNDNIPFFTEQEMTTDSFERYSELDKLGRCGVAYANVSKDLMPTEARKEIGHIKPSGWHTIKYPEVIADRYLYNRCHLIAFELTGENENECNLITGTRFMNVEGMLPFENRIAEYVRRTGNHVLYRVTPSFEENELVARGVLLEAYSVEDSGIGISFCVFCPNVQPGVKIDYRNGDSCLDDVS